jgi:hypothetical protein
MADYQKVLLGDKTNYSFYTNKYGANSISNLNKIILDYINKVYSKYGFKYGVNEDLEIEDLIINSEYLSKMVNNYTIFKAVIKYFQIDNEGDFYNIVQDNLEFIYNFESDFFIQNTLPILINTTRRGNIGEKICKAVFSRFAKNKGLNIRLENPTIEEDISGIDAKFIYEGKYIYIQIKPFNQSNINDTNYTIKSQGSLSLGADISYLMLYDNRRRIIIAKNTKKSPILIKGEYFVIPKENVSYNNL